MKKLSKIIGIIALVAVIGFGMLSCDDATVEVTYTTGTLNITNNTAAPITQVIIYKGVTEASGVEKQDNGATASIPIGSITVYAIGPQATVSYLSIPNGEHLVKVTSGQTILYRLATIKGGETTAVSWTGSATNGWSTTVPGGNTPTPATGTLTITNKSSAAISSVKIYSGSTATGTPVKTDTTAIAINGNRSYSDLAIGNYIVVVADAMLFEDSATFSITATSLTVALEWDADFGLNNTTIRVDSVTVDPTTLSLVAGATTGNTITATVSPSNATNSTVTWSSDKEDIATVVGGVVTAKAAGTATITAAADGKSATCTVTVTAGKGTLRITNPAASIAAIKKIAIYSGTSASGTVVYNDKTLNVAINSNKDYTLDAGSYYIEVEDDTEFIKNTTATITAGATTTKTWDTDFTSTTARLTIKNDEVATITDILIFKNNLGGEKVIEDKSIAISKDEYKSYILPAAGTYFIYGIDDMLFEVYSTVTVTAGQAKTLTYATDFDDLVELEITNNTSSPLKTITIRLNDNAGAIIYNDSNYNVAQNKTQSFSLPEGTYYIYIKDDSFFEKETTFTIINGTKKELTWDTDFTDV